jgi:hypothetical protein
MNRRALILYAIALALGFVGSFLDRKAGTERVQAAPTEARVPHVSIGPPTIVYGEAPSH